MLQKILAKHFIYSVRLQKKKLEKNLKKVESILMSLEQTLLKLIEDESFISSNDFLEWFSSLLIFNNKVNKYKTLTQKYRIKLRGKHLLYEKLSEKVEFIDLFVIIKNIESKADTCDKLVTQILEYCYDRNKEPVSSCQDIVSKEVAVDLVSK